jgi:sarcosine oxidase
MLGGLDFGAGRNVEGLAEHLAAQGVPHELLPAHEAERRWPGMCFEDGVLFHPQAGTMDAARAIEAFVAEAVRHGAEVSYETECVSLLPAGDRTVLELHNGGRVSANSAVVAAGAWIGPLVDGLVAFPALSVTQQQIFHFPRLDLDAEPWPSVIHGNPDLIYHLAGGRDGGPGDDRKIAEHLHGTATTAAGRSSEVDPASRARVIEYVRRWLPGLDPYPRGEATCLYTTTPSEDFVLDRVGGLVICSACSGHGAKFAPLIGELTANLVTSPGTAQIPVRFRLASHRR